MFKNLLVVVPIFALMLVLCYITAALIFSTGEGPLQVFSLFVVWVAIGVGAQTGAVHIINRFLNKPAPRS